MITRETLAGLGCVFFGAFANRLYLKNTRSLSRKPIPKTQKQISIDQQQPSDPRFGNPNIPIPTQFNETGIDFSASH